MNAHQEQMGSGSSSDMKKNGSKKKFFILLSACILLCAAVILIISQQKKAGVSETRTLRASLYPIVPDMERYKKAVTMHWEAKNPDTKLELVDWYCYDEDLPDDLDVFVFDGIYLTEYLEKGYLLPIPEEAIQDIEDFIPFTTDGLRRDGTFCAVPQLICTSLLYTRKGDTELADVSDTVMLYEKLGDRKNQSEVPDENEGLLIDMSGGTSKVIMYLDAQIDYSDTYTEYEDLPVKETFSEEALDLLRLLVKMGGAAQVKYMSESDELYERARWFAEGKGRAYIGYSETMAMMGDGVNDIDFRIFSNSDRGGVPLFSVDLAGVNAKISDDKKELAYELVDMITSEEAMAKVVMPEGKGTPQYLLPARIHIYDPLSEASPVYGQLKVIALDPKNKFLRMGSNAHEYISNTKKELPDLVFPKE